MIRDLEATDPDPIPPPRWIRTAAILAPATAVPSALWRLAVLAGVHGPAHPVTIGMRSELGDVLLVSVGSVAILSLTIGLVSRWGYRFSTKTPLLPLVPAFAGGLALTLIALIVLTRSATGSAGAEAVQLNGTELLMVKLAYAPLLFSGPLVLLVANDYRIRTRSSAKGRRAAG